MRLLASERNRNSRHAALLARREYYLDLERITTDAIASRCAPVFYIHCHARLLWGESGDPNQQPYFTKPRPLCCNSILSDSKRSAAVTSAAPDSEILEGRNGSIRFPEKNHVDGRYAHHLVDVK